MQKNRIQEFRESRHLTQRELGVLVGVAQQSINKYEKGEILPSLVVSLKLANVLHTKVEDLFPGLV